MKIVLFISLIIMLNSCQKQEVELTPIINTKDSTLSLVYKNNLAKDIVINKEPIVISNIKSIVPTEEIIQEDPYIKDIRLTKIIPYNEDYNTITKDNFPFLLDNKDYLKSISSMNDQIVIISKSGTTSKVYKINGYQSGEQLKLSLKNGLGLKSKKGLFIFKDSIKINDIRVIK